MSLNMNLDLGEIEDYSAKISDDELDDLEQDYLRHQQLTMRRKSRKPFAAQKSQLPPMLDFFKMVNVPEGDPVVPIIDMVLTKKSQERLSIAINSACKVKISEIIVRANDIASSEFEKLTPEQQAVSPLRVTAEHIKKAYISLPKPRPFSYHRKKL
ncbi:hypothetical protein PCE1_003064 [Barthelona sp. PCE]